MFKARLFGELESSMGELLGQKRVEIFLVRPMENKGVWKVLAKPGKRVVSGMKVRFASDFFCEVVAKEDGGSILVQFSDDEDMVMKKANQYGHIPVPPYVKHEPDDFSNYQTVYAKHEGSVAAPTAGFHFTPELIEKIKEKGVDFAEITLHVGLGTFLPVKSDKLSDHVMHSEWVELDEENARKINKAKEEGRRVIAVGTTVVRTLEGIASFHDQDYEGPNFLRSYSNDINIFITPGFDFRVVDGLITNFHLPKSTLLMLVCAFARDTDFMLKCYIEAVEEKYRFYSFGDAMFIHN